MRTLVLALALLASAPVAGACSVAPGYRVPTTLQLVDEADAIVVAQVGQPGISADGEPELWFRAVTTLKGPTSSKEHSDQITARAPGMLGTRVRPATPGDPAELVRANPEAHAGGCTRFTFHPKKWVVLFLKREGEGYRVMSYPFARTAEDTALPDSRWLKAVREYVAIAALPTAMRRARMEARRDLLRARRDADSRAIAADLERELNGPRKPLREPLPAAPSER
ncbi:MULTISPECIES: hypothetical protein [unclassified Sphingomonas]|uniref:hypothetical protein n=1 Tax=unclassified Sphingomonas TaxID=196159 RepID=UPI002150D3F7|nr:MULTISPECIES: hypothetical protein [unclassified Sphingomonas]MCR5871880.1 hypothetical protein [Sphingomonas sp. J344]UUX99835.1 hypothetical protein LRS08_01360 [Sphingomonas sp. J315]